LKNFADEPEVVKRQTLNLGSKLYVKSRKSAAPFFDHLLNLAKYDPNYDIRDSARLMRVLIVPSGDEPENAVAQRYRKALFENKKPSPVMTSWASDASRFSVGSLSLMVNHTFPGYQKLAEFPEVQPDSTVRDTHEAVSPTVEQAVRGKKGKKEKKFSESLDDFYASSETSDESDSDEDSDESVDPFYGSGSGSDSDSDESDSDGSEDDEESSDEDDSSEEESSEEESSEEESSEEESSEEESDDDAHKKNKKQPASKKKSGSDFDLDRMLGIPSGSGSSNGPLSPNAALDQQLASLQLK
jgi:AP-3 complex subunit beta